MNRRLKICQGVAVLLFLVTTIAVLAEESTNRPANWAQKIQVAGIQNCYCVTTNLYRGAQPTAEGMAQLKAMGIKTVVNLRAWHSDKDKVAGTGLVSVRF